MRKFTTLLSLMFCFSLFAQNVNLNEPLPVNNKIKKGVLSNGMTYYIYNTDVTKDVAMQKVAKAEFAANLRVSQVQDDMLGEVLDIMA